MLFGNQSEVISPNQLKNQPIGAVVFDTLFLVPLHFFVDAARGNAAERKPGRQFGTVIHADKPVACLLVVFEKVFFPKIGLEPLLRSRFSPANVQPRLLRLLAVLQSVCG